MTLTKKSLSISKAAKLLMADIGFPKLQFLLESFNFVVGNKYCHFPWSNRHFGFFLKNMSNVWVWITNKNSAQKQELVQLSTHCFSSRHWTLVRSRCFMRTFHFITQNIKKTCNQGLRFSKINFFKCFIKNILKWNWLVCLTASMWQWRTLEFGATPRICAKALAVSLSIGPLLLCHQCKCHSERQIMS